MPIPINPKTGLEFPTGATTSPLHKLFAAHWHEVVKAPPPQIAYVPKQLSAWKNDTYGDCVTAEEAYAKACYNTMFGGPEIFIPDEEVVRWARSHGVLNGAGLSEVLDWMEAKGFVVGGQLYNNGRPSVVEYSDQTILQSGIAQGPVKIAMAAGALPSGAGSQQGWWTTGDPRNRRTDHCTTLTGYGPAGYLYQQLQLGGHNVTLPSALPSDTHGYLLFTWGTIGFVDYKWIMGTCDEAWVRNPTTIGVPPLPDPSPPPTPIPPSPGPAPQLPVEIEITGHVMPDKYLLFPKAIV